MLGINRKVTFDGAMPEYDLSKFTPLEVKAGTLIALHHSNVHFSEHNTSSKSRHAYSLHVVDGSDQHIWQPDNWYAPLSPACSALMPYPQMPCGKHACVVMPEPVALEAFLSHRPALLIASSAGYLTQLLMKGIIFFCRMMVLSNQDMGCCISRSMALLECAGCRDGLISRLSQCCQARVSPQWSRPDAVGSPLLITVSGSVITQHVLPFQDDGCLPSID